MATLKDYSPEDQKKIQDYIKKSGGMADFGSAVIVTGVKPASSNSTGGSSGTKTSSSGSSGTKTSSNGWVLMVSPDGRIVNTNPANIESKLARGYTYAPEGARGRSGGGGGSSSRSSSGSSSRSSSSSSSIDDAYKEQMKALRAQIQAGIAKAKGQYSNIISQAPQTYQPLRNQVSLSKEQQLQALRESLANQGNRGGTGRQAMLGISTAAENQLGDINLQQQNVIDEANRAIADIEQQGQFQESQLTAELAAQKLRELLAQEQRAGEMAEDTRRFNVDFELRQQAAKDKAADALRKQFIDTIGQYANDYQARINELQNDGDPTNDWQIPYLKTARQGKIDDAMAKWQEQGYVSEDIAAALGKPVGTMTEAYKLKLQDAARQAEVQYALKLFEDLGRATPEIAAILARYGLPSDAMTLNALKTQYSINKPYHNPNTGGDSYGLSW